MCIYNVTVPTTQQQSHAHIAYVYVQHAPV